MAMFAVDELLMAAFLDENEEDRILINFRLGIDPIRGLPSANFSILTLEELRQIQEKIIEEEEARNRKIIAPPGNGKIIGSIR
jgi:hypothetical protein